MMDSERAKEFKSSLMWAEIKEEIDIKIYHRTQKLVTCNLDEVKPIQMEIKVLQEIKNLPDDVIYRESGEDTRTPNE